MRFEVNLVNFRGTKSGPVAFLGFLSLKVYLTIKTTQDKKRRVRSLFVGKDAQVCKVRRRAGAY